MSSPVHSRMRNTIKAACRSLTFEFMLAAESAPPDRSRTKWLLRRKR
jgi:hypothetical protein